jgi:O-antigen/teichoic acid export membrane protein
MHWSRIFRNMLSNWMSYVVTAVVGFVLAPIVVHSLGDTGYGLWTLVLALTGYFGLLDLGVRSSVGRFVTRYIALSDAHNVNRTVGTAFVILSCGGIVAFLATLLIAMFFFGSFGVEPHLANQGRTALVLTGLNMGLILPLGVFSAVLIALERFDVLSGVTMVGELARAALVVWFLRNGYGLVALALIALSVTVAQYTVMGVIAKVMYRPLHVHYRYVDWSSFRDLFGFSIYRFIWIVANQLIFYSDSLVIAVFLGAGAITPYAIAGSLINYGRNVVSLVTDTLAPSAARMDAKEDLAGLQRLLLVGTRLALLVTLPICVGFLFLGRQFITLWMGESYAHSAIFLMVLTIPQFGSMPQYVSALVLAGMAKHRAFAYFALAEGIANVVLSVILVQRMGLIGVAWGTAITHLVNTTVVVPLYTLSVLKLSVREYFVKAFLRPLVCAVPLAALGYRFSLLETASWPIFAAEASAMCGVFGLISYFVCFDAQQRAAVAQKLGAMLQRQTVAHEA